MEIEIGTEIGRDRDGWEVLSIGPRIGWVVPVLISLLTPWILDLVRHRILDPDSWIQNPRNSAVLSCSLLSL